MRQYCWLSGLRFFPLLNNYFSLATTASMDYDGHGMKRFLCILSALVILLAPTAFAQEDGTVVIPTPTPAVDYPLPYPGILPNHFLYPLKMARDKIILFLIADPQKRAEFNLLQADKRLQAAIFLVQEDKNNAQLAVTTIEKGENYYHDAVQQAIGLQKEGKDVTGLLSNLDHAARKHLIIIADLQKTLSAQSQQLAQLKARMQSYQLQVIQARKQ